MTDNYYKNEKRYILALTPENFDKFLLKRAISDNCLKPDCRFCDINNVLNRVLSRISKKNKIFLLNQVINQITTSNEETLDRFINWITMSSILLFTLKDLYMSKPVTALDLLKAYDAREEYLKCYNMEKKNTVKTLEKIENDDLIMQNVLSNQTVFATLLSIKENNIYNIYIEKGYTVNYINEYISEKLKLEAILKLYKCNKLQELTIILKSPEHIFSLNPQPIEFIEDLFNNTIYNRLHIQKRIPIINYEIIDEIVVNNYTLPNVDTKIMHLTKSSYLTQRISSFCNYFSPDVIPLGELLDIESYKNNTDY